MVTKVILVGDVTVQRKATAVLPEGITGEQLVSLLNSGEATENAQGFLCNDGTPVLVDGKEIVSQNLVWRLDSAVETEESAEHDHDHENGCGCGDHCHPTAEQMHLGRTSTMTQMVFEFCQSKDVRNARRAQALAEAFYELSGGGINDTYIWVLSGRSFIAQTAGHLKAAAKHASYVLKIARAMHGDDHHLTAVVTNNYADVLNDQGKFDVAEQHLRAGIEVLDKTIAGGDAQLKGWAVNARKDAIDNLRRALAGLGRTEEAAQLS